VLQHTSSRFVRDDGRLISIFSFLPHWKTDAMASASVRFHSLPTDRYRIAPGKWIHGGHDDAKRRFFVLAAPRGAAD
jgi:hypothetical protein